MNHHWERDYTELLESHNLLKTRYLKVKKKCTQVQEENTRLVARYEGKIDDSHKRKQEHDSFSIDDMDAIKMQVNTYTQYNVVFTFIRRRSNVMDVVETLKQCCERTGLLARLSYYNLRPNLRSRQHPNHFRRHAFAKMTFPERLNKVVGRSNLTSLISI